LYKIGDKLYEQHEALGKHLSTKTNDLFNLSDKIIFYDLTNTYFEGRKSDSELAQFGRSKEKRSDAKLVSLALVVNAEGFIKYNKIYEGNIYQATKYKHMPFIPIRNRFAKVPIGITRSK